MHVYDVYSLVHHFVQITILETFVLKIQKLMRGPFRGRYGLIHSFERKTFVVLLSPATMLQNFLCAHRQVKNTWQSCC